MSIQSRRRHHTSLFPSSWTVMMLAALFFSTTTTIASAQTCDKTGCDHWETDPSKEEDLQRWQAELTNTTKYNWEWVIVRLDGIAGLSAADWFHAADASVEVEAVLTTPAVLPEGIEFYSDWKLNKFVFETQNNDDTPEWYKLGMVIYEQGTATQLQFLLKDADAAGMSDTLIDQTIDIPSVMDTWVTNQTLAQDDYTLTVSLYRSHTPIASSADQTNMGLTEELIELEGDNIASLVHKTSPNNDKAVLYLAGKADVFAHPHVLSMYEARGYDVYSLDPRYCGRTMRFMDNTQYAHWIDDLDKYREEVDYTMEFIQNAKNYTTTLMHCHSTGCLVALNYVMQLQGEDTTTTTEPFDGYIMNSPFLDWGHVGGQFYEFILENAGFFQGIIENPLEANGISVWAFRFWVLYRFPTDWRTIIQTHTNAEWAQATTDVQNDITTRDLPVTNQPTFLIASRGDDTLIADESADRMKFVAQYYSYTLLDHNMHDVTMSFTNDLNEEALTEMTAWLDCFENNTTSAQAVAICKPNKGVESSSAAAAGGGWGGRFAGATHVAMGAAVMAIMMMLV